jgi:hypothetical protein
MKYYDDLSFVGFSPKMLQTLTRIMIIPQMRLLHFIMEISANPRSQGDTKTHTPITSSVQDLFTLLS